MSFRVPRLWLGHGCRRMFRKHQEESYVQARRFFLMLSKRTPRSYRVYNPSQPQYLDFPGFVNVYSLFFSVKMYLKKYKNHKEFR